MTGENSFLNLYANEMISNMMQINPKWDETKVEEIVKDLMRKDLKNPVVTLDNNFTGESRETTLVSVFDWALKRKPIIAGNGTFYKNQDEAINPIATMLDMFLAQRKAYKKEMFKVGEVQGTECVEYKDKDRLQGNEKINANS